MKGTWLELLLQNKSRMVLENTGFEQSYTEGKRNLGTVKNIPAGSAHVFSANPYPIYRKPYSRTAPRRAAWTFILLSNLDPHFPWHDKFYSSFPILWVFRDYRVVYEVHDLSLQTNAFIIDYTRCIHLKAFAVKKKINGYVKVINSLLRFTKGFPSESTFLRPTVRRYYCVVSSLIFCMSFLRYNREKSSNVWTFLNTVLKRGKRKREGVEIQFSFLPRVPLIKATRRCKKMRLK